MPHHFALISTIAAGLGLALLLGFLAVRLKLPILVGYLLAGVLIGPATPGFVADVKLAHELSEIGVILLMFGVGLQFSLHDLLSVKGIAIPGAIAQIAVATGLGVAVALFWGWSFGAGLVFGLCLSVASTVVLLRALEDHDQLDSINGRIAAAKSNLPTENYFKFAARKGQQVILEVNARRLGSSLDSLLEVLDAAGNPVEQAVARATWETFLVLRDHDSMTRGLRIQSWNSLSTGDYVMVGNEIVRVDEVPDGPDEDMTVESFGAQRKAFFNTSSEAHGIDRAVYKVQMHPAGAQFSPNGLPLVRFYFRNDDGGPGYGKDSLISFTAPADGEYIARLRDVRGLGGDDFAYRLNIREPRPDFELSVSPRNPNVPRGGSIPVTVTALKREGFNAPIEVSFASLPAGLKATKNTIAPGLDNTTLLLSADETADLKDAVAFDVTGKATVNGRAIAHRASPDDDMKLIALMPRADVRLLTKTKVVELAPGETAEVTVAAERANGFAGRVPVIVTDLPSRVRVTDSGLNGVLIHEDGDNTTFRLWALPNAEPTEGYIYLSARIETRSPQQNMYASVEPVLVRVKAATQISAKTPTPVERSSAPK